MDCWRPSPHTREAGTPPSSTAPRTHQNHTRSTPSAPAAVVKPSPTGRQVEGTQCPRIPLVPPFKVVSSSAVVNSGRASISSIFSSDTEKEGKGYVPYHSGGLMLGTREQPPDTRRSRSRSPRYSRSRSRSPQRDSRPVRRRSRSRSSSESSQSRSRRRQYRRSRSDSRDRTTRRGTRYSSPRRSRYSSSRSSSRGRRSSSRGRRYSRSLSRTKRYSRSPSRDRRRPPRRDRSPSSDDRRSSQRSSRRNRSSSRSSRYRSRSRSVSRGRRSRSRSASRGRYRSRSRDVSPKSSSSSSKRRRSKSPRKTSEKRKDKEESHSSPKKKSKKSKKSKKDKGGVSGGDVTAAQKAKPTDTASWCSIITEPISCDSGPVKGEENGVSNEQRGTVTTISKLPAETALKMEELFLPWVQGLIETDTTVHEDERREAAAELEDFGSIHDVLMDLEGEELKETLEELQLWWPVDDVQMTVE
ncbi:serine/arginine repetitive matrix protein 2-like [Paramacrobiotus metropolitanus]|uniref:serine/arginine repetitive matrix protein 2-like n=1 Tax=Paramacrobiotus metropolitanus TaxID=2943436 RepID=UPI0024462DB2|nr:serine/arginine repetitive matrix protein 2-like [Paramacrobiotus metropolitanus]XP_055343103.1 serine/arginine repetitive matrix protein 2-like [Paramacrobiotus metropolitanus]